MKSSITLFFVFLFISLSSFSQKLVSYELIKSIEMEELRDLWKKNGIKEFIVPLSNGVEVYEIIYWSEWHDGTPVKASGFYYRPKIEGQDFPFVVYHHGTRLRKERSFRVGGENAICLGFAADGYMVAMPDYLGLGKGDKFHLYQHADSEAQASIDMIRAIDELNEELHTARNEMLFITGYSQGGHATLALHRKLQNEYPDEFPVTASSPMSGPYDLSGVMSEVMNHPYGHPSYLPYLMNGYQEVYKFVDGGLAEALRSPFDTLIPPMLNGEYSLNQINKLLPEVPKEIMKEALIEHYENDPDFPFRKALEENSVYKWAPEAPVQLCFCEADEQVSYKNAIVAHKAMKELGAEKVILRRGGRRFTHNQCALYTSIYSKFWFDSFVKGKKSGRKGPVTKRMLIGVSKMKMFHKDKK